MNLWKDRRLYFKRFSIFFLGLFLIQVGVAFMLNLDIGSDPFTLFTQGVAKTIHITVGAANCLVTLILCVVLLIFHRSYIKFGTLFSILFAGMIMDMMYGILGRLPIYHFNIVVSSILFVVGLIPIAAGVPLIKMAEIGVAPNDSLYFALQDVTKKPYGRVRVLTDAVYFVLGMLCKGVFGVGTILCLVCLGPMATFMFPRAEKLVRPWLTETSSSRA